MPESPAPTAADPRVQAGFDIACRLLEQLADQTATETPRPHGANMAGTLRTAAEMLRRWGPCPYWEQPGYVPDEEGTS